MDTLIDRKDYKVFRFACDCFSAEHSLTIGIEWRNNGDVVFCSIEPYLAGKPSLKWRVKQAIKCLKGKDGNMGDFVLRPEDYSEIVRVISLLGQSRNTSGANST